MKGSRQRDRIKEGRDAAARGSTKKRVKNSKRSGKERNNGKQKDDGTHWAETNSDHLKPKDRTKENPFKKEEYRSGRSSNPKES